MPIPPTLPPPTPGIVAPSGRPPPPPMSPLGSGADAFTSFAQGDFVMSLSISSLDHCDGSFLFQKSDSLAFHRVLAPRTPVQPNSRTPRRVNCEVSRIVN